MTDVTYREAVRADLPAVIALLADDVLGRAREAHRFYLGLGFVASHEGMKLAL
ncbi:hypothetical protein LADH09A_000734 [Micromonospora sp. LAH09]|nr:hypothetical protein [Micromonospora cabrerizensis]MCG5472880.1 hypothetical protein [Micromonospora cabrerizensis]